ncbi:hypothetical protein [Devosia aquimaris]|nr:hypothetical protein [Devosia sp. CJK-A8-3]
MQLNNGNRAAHWTAPVLRALMLLGMFALAMLVLVLAYSETATL